MGQTNPELDYNGFSNYDAANMLERASRLTVVQSLRRPYAASYNDKFVYYMLPEMECLTCSETRTKFLTNSDTNFRYVHAADGVSYPDFYWPGGTVFSPQASRRRRACSYNNDFELSAVYF